MDDAERLQGFIETWRVAAADFVTLARTIPENQWSLPTDLEGWDVRDNIAHTAHLEAVLAGAPEETVEVAEAPHIKGITGWYTEQGVLARRDRSMAELADEIEQSVASRLSDLRDTPPTDAAAPPPRTPGGVPWNTGTLLSNRPLDIWMHEQDIRRAIGRPGGFDSPAADHVIGVFGASLPMVLGKRVGAEPGTSVVLDVDGREFGAVVGDDGRATAEVVADPTVRITLSAEDYVVRAGGRRGVDAVAPTYAEDDALGQRVVENLAVTP
ncbi:MAG: maleylpyruvate isomerase family mycothiol-dependent enzyme [Myxococcales bacterium]|nr:MAG: maleylpyruvate isomerase family mycothiol-dependent enzyme [Myxococcales bacterium]